MKTTFLSTVALVLLSGRANSADAPSYTKDVKPFLKTYCLECHGGRDTKKGISVDSIASMMIARNLLVPGDPDKSRLYRAMTGGGKQMPPRKFGKTPTKDEIAMMKAWIAAGAKDDTATPTPEPKGTPESKEPKGEEAAARQDVLDLHDE